MSRRWLSLNLEVIIMLYENYPELENIKSDIDAVIDMLIDCYKNGGKLLCAGNGGSAADSEHIVGELMKGFLLKRPVTDSRIPAELADKLQGALPAISLSNGLALPTAYLNDVDGEYTIAQTLYGLAKPGDIVLLISTSGNAKNLAHAAELARCIGVKTIGLTGRGGGRLAELCDITIKAPADETYRIQEYHLPIYHEICARVEAALFSR
ncbi:MAG: SIS domain-containing protein [Clostridiales bacterium]|nr:SIS domain-containing protein [Clostridiales bacterium]